MISDLRAALQGTLICGLLMMGCGLVGDTTRPRDVERTSEVVFQTVADGLAGYVSIDSHRVGAFSAPTPIKWHF